MPRAKEGQEIGGWTLLEFLGKGGNGEVWKASHADGRQCAMKILRDSRPGSVPLSRFAREVSIVVGLGEQSGVVPIIDSHVPEEPARKERVWYVMPVAEPLRVRLGGQPVEDIVESVRDLARTLEDLHRVHGLAHRDVKPDNLFWHHDRSALSDFGLVHVPGADALTEPERIPGAFGFIADEVMIGSDDIDWHLADVFSLAKVLWVLLNPTSLYPPQGALTADGGPSTLVRSLTVSGAAGLDLILENATKHQSTRTPMSEFADELDSWLDSPRSLEFPDAVSAALARARRSMEGTLADRDASRLREEKAEKSFRRLQAEAGDVVEAVLRVDPAADVGPYAVGSLKQWIEHEEYMGGPVIVSTYHHGARISRDEGGLSWILVVAFCLQVAEDGTAFVDGLLMAGFEDVMGGGGRNEPLGRRSAPVGSVQLDGTIVELTNEARSRLPDVVSAFAEGRQ